MPFPPEDNNICSSCGTEFGYDDAKKTYHQIRQEWVDRGAKWFSNYALPPSNWNPYLQMNAAHLLYTLPFAVKKVRFPDVEQRDNHTEILAPIRNLSDGGAKLSIVIR
jgi:hypothetical protein